MTKSFRRTTLTLLTSIALLGACSTHYTLRPAERTLGAAATLSLDKGSDGNTRLQLEAKYLPLPDSLGPSLKTYVVWVREANEMRPVNVGQLRIDSDRKGTLVSSTPFQKFDVFVTAERDGTVQTPSDYIVLSVAEAKP